MVRLISNESGSYTLSCSTLLVLIIHRIRNQKQQKVIKKQQAQLY